MLEYLVFRLLSILAPLTPPRAAYLLSDWLGSLAYRLLPRQRGSVRSNLSRVLRDHPEELEKRARAVFREGVKYYYDTFRVPALTGEEIERVVTLAGVENLETGLSRGKGVIIVTAHLGSPALVAQVLAVRGYKVTTPVEPVRNRRLFDLMTRVRGSQGITFVQIGPSATRELMAALRQNQIVGIVADRDLQKNGMAVEFFGAETSLPSGPAMLALRSGATLIPGFAYRRRDGGYDGIIEQPLELERTGDLRGDLLRNTRRLAEALERGIARSPEQWVVFEPVWPRSPKTRPGVAN